MGTPPLRIYQLGINIVSIYFNCCQLVVIRKQEEEGYFLAFLLESVREAYAK